MTRALIIHLNQSIVLLYQKYRNLLEKVYVGLLIVIDHTNNISKYEPLSGSDYIKLPKKLDYARKILINIQSTEENKFLKWCLVRHLDPLDQNPTRIRKTNKEFVKDLNLKI